MDRPHDVDVLLQQVRSMIMNRLPAPAEVCGDKGLATLQEALAYLAGQLAESNEFLIQLAAGNLDAQPPDRHNFIAASLKELHSGLRHLSWQAKQVAHGDYHQRVNFLGSFSDSFNQMTTQLEEREARLKSEADALKKSRELLISVMDVVKDEILVVEQENGTVIYTNQAARKLFYDMETGQHVCNHECPLLDTLRTYGAGEQFNEQHYEFYCCISKRILSVDSFYILWNGIDAYTHIISDVTQNRAEEARLKNMAFFDELTGLYNRRYCLSYLTEILQEDRCFSICFIDLDHLKYVNDTFGHNSGDEYITSVVSQIMQFTRITDTVCRIGGDEFVLLLPNCDEGHAELKLASMHQAVSELKLRYPTAISYGIICVQPGTTLSPEKLLQQADKKMYLFKRAHRKQNI